MSNIDISVKGVAGIVIPLAAIYLIKTVKDVACKWLDTNAATATAASAAAKNNCDCTCEHLREHTHTHEHKCVYETTQAQPRENTHTQPREPTPAHQQESHIPVLSAQTAVKPAAPSVGIISDYKH